MQYTELTHQQRKFPDYLSGFRPTFLTYHLNQNPYFTPDLQTLIHQSHTYLHTITHWSTHNHTLLYTQSHSDLHTVTHWSTHNHTLIYTQSHTDLHTITHWSTHNHTLIYTQPHSDLHTITLCSIHSFLYGPYSYPWNF